MSLQAVLTAVADVCRTVPGIRAVSNGPAEQANELPAIWLWFGEVPAGNVRASTAEGGYLWLRRVVLRVLVARSSDLPTEYGRLVPFIDSVAAAFAGNVTLGGTVSRCVLVGHGEPGMVDAGRPCVTTDLYLEIKEHVPAALAG